MNISKTIEKLGYKLGEARVYLTAFALGESTVSEIATKAKMPRSSTQFALDKLHKDGLMSFYIRKRYKYWVAEQPAKLMQKLKQDEEILASAMDDILALQNKTKSKPVVKVFMGKDEIKLVFKNMIQSKHNISGIIPWEMWINLLGEHSVDKFTDLRIKHFLNLRLLVPKTEKSIELKNKDPEEHRNTKFLPKDLVVEDTLFIYNDTVVIISLDEHHPTGVVICDPATYRTMKAIFENLWKGSQN